jgi:hypothetical protein
MLEVRTHNAQGTVVESYLHPITGETVRSTRICKPAPIAALNLNCARLCTATDTRSAFLRWR